MLPHLSKPTYVRLTLPQSIDGGPDSQYPDVRIADSANREVPYALDADPLEPASATVTLTDIGFVPGHYTQAIADLGTSGTLHTTFILGTTQLTFFEHVEVATSDDRKTWAIVRPNALIYKIAENGDAGTTSIDFGPSRARWLRIRVLDGAHEFPITAAYVATVTAPPRLIPLVATKTTRADGANTVVHFDFGVPNTNASAVAFETTTPSFSRRAVVLDASQSPDPNVSPQLNAATISRYPSGAPTLTIDLANQHLQFLDVRIENGNDPPLANLRVTPLGYEHHVVFLAKPGESYRLLWGNSAAEAPVYDLKDRLLHEGWSAGPVATLGAAASTVLEPSGPAPSATPWLQQAALPIALAVGCVVLAAVVLFSLRSKSAGGES